MDEMHAFERQIASVVQQTTRAPRPVDVGSIVGDVADEPQGVSFGSMLSASKLLVAGLVVALFGGILLSGMVTKPSDDLVPAATTTSPTPSMIDEALAGMVTEEVEPGIMRVVADPVWNMEDIRGEPPELSITVGHDGGVWVFEETGFFRLPDGRRHSWPESRQDPSGCAVSLPASSRSYPQEGRSCYEVAADGTVWIGAILNSDEAVVRSYDGTNWTDHHLPLGGRRDLLEGVEVEVTDDGSVWAITRGEGWSRLSRLDGDTWADLGPVPGTAVPGTFHVTDDGDIWVGTQEPGGGDSGIYVRRVATGQWAAERPGVNRAAPSTLTVEPGGTAWVGGTGMGWLFGRRDDDGWTAWSAVSEWTEPRFGRRLIAASPDGSVWLSPAQAGGCGLGNFDENGLRVLLPMTCFYALDIAADGTVWAFGESQDGPSNLGLHVITPAAGADLARIPATDRWPDVDGDRLPEWSGPDDRLRGSTTERIGTGVLRVLADAEGNGLAGVEQVAIAADGTVWLASGMRIGRLGEEQFDDDPHEDASRWKLAMGGDGVPIFHEGGFAGAVAYLADGDWKAYPSDTWDSLGPAYRSSSGDLWVAAFFDRDDLAVGRYADDRWTWWDRDEVGIGAGLIVDIAETRDGSIWVGVDNFGGPSEAGLSRFDGREWHPVDPFSSGGRFAVNDLEVASDGTLWVGLMGAEGRSDTYLGRWDGSAWTVKPRPHGRLWGLPTDVEDDPGAWPTNVAVPDAIPGFEAWADHATLARAPDGSVWLTTDAGLYVVDPEAAAAAE